MREEKSVVQIFDMSKYWQCLWIMIITICSGTFLIQGCSDVYRKRNPWTSNNHDGDNQFLFKSFVLHVCNTSVGECLFALLCLENQLSIYYSIFFYSVNLIALYYFLIFFSFFNSSSCFWRKKNTKFMCINRSVTKPL